MKHFETEHRFGGPYDGANHNVHADFDEDTGNFTVWAGDDDTGEGEEIFNGTMLAPTPDGAFAVQVEGTWYDEPFEAHEYTLLGRDPMMIATYLVLSICSE